MAIIELRQHINFLNMMIEGRTIAELPQFQPLKAELYLEREEYIKKLNQEVKKENG